MADSPDPTEGLPELPEGMVWSKFPYDSSFISDPLWYDAFGRDILSQRKIFAQNMTEKPDEHIAKVQEVLDEFPNRVLDIMFKAAVKGSPHIIEYLLSKGVNPIAGEGQDETLVPLHAAAYNGHLDCVKILVEKGQMDVNFRDEIGGTPLMRAAYGKHPDIVRWLLENGADPTCMQTKGESTALEFACGDIQALKLIHEAWKRKREQEGIADHKELIRGITLLTAQDAATFEYVLREAGFPMEDEEGLSKSDRLNEEQRKILEGILSDPNFPPPKDVGKLRLLLSYFTRIDSNGNPTFFELAPSMDHGNVISNLLSSALNGHIEVMEMLLNTIFIAPDGTRPLIHERLPDPISDAFFKAAEHGQPDTVKLLLEKYDAKIDHTSLEITRGVTPIYVAAANNRLEVLEYLLKHHSPDLHIGNGLYANGATPLWIAVAESNPEATKLLLQHGGPVEIIVGEQPTEFPARLQLTYTKAPRAPVLMEWIEDDGRRGHVVLRNETGNAGVVLDIGKEDEEWLGKVQIRKDNEYLREHSGGRELRLE